MRSHMMLRPELIYISALIVHQLTKIDVWVVKKIVSQAKY